MLGDVGAVPECEVETLVTLDHSAFQVRSSGYGGVGIVQYSREGLHTGNHEKATVPCRISLFAALHGALRTPG